MKSNFLSLLGVSFAFCCGLGWQAASAQSGASTIDDMVKALTSSPHRSPTPAVEKEVGEYIDYQYISRYAMGSRAWDRLDESKKQKYMALVRRSIEQKYYKRWHKLFAKGSLTGLGESRSNGDTLVRTALTVGKKKTIVIWRLHGNERQLKVISLRVDNEDLLERLKKRFQKILLKEGPDKLINKLAHKVEDEDDIE